MAAEWAYEHAASMPVSLRGFRRRGAPAAVLYAVDGIAKACIPDPEGLLRDLLAGVIADCTAAVRATPQPQRQVPAASA
jgi:hypothetical protein